MRDAAISCLTQIMQTVSLENEGNKQDGICLCDLHMWSRLPLMIKSHDHDECQSNREQCPTGTKYLPATRTWQGVSGIMLYIHLAHYITALRRPVKSASVATKWQKIAKTGKKSIFFMLKSTSRQGCTTSEHYLNIFLRNPQNWNSAAKNLQRHHLHGCD